MKNFGKCSLLFIAIIFVFWNFEKSDCHVNRSSNFDSMIVTLWKNVKFMHDRPEQMNVDAVFGLNFVEAHTTALLEHKNAFLLGEKNRRLVKEISKLCEIVRIDGRKMLSTSELEGMIRPEIWNYTIPWKRGALGPRPEISSGLTRAKARLIIYQGTPAEAESSRCIRELVRSSANLECVPSTRCEEMLVRKDNPRGYPLTHRLLYVETAVALGCIGRDEVSFVELKRDYCASIMKDLVDLEATKFPPPSSDLAMEQILLCGMEGYLEFANSHYANLIMSWPNSHGCYSAFSFHGTNEDRVKRSTSFMDYGCDNHASGVAAASLSLLIRAAVENYFHEIS